jgi:hypothetical protein
MKDVEGNAADLISLVIGDEDGVMAISEVRMLAQKTPRQFIGRIHGFDIAGQVCATGIGHSSGVDQIKVIKWHSPLRASVLKADVVV